LESFNEYRTVMKIKSYFADTVEAAMALARQELGADAMLVHSKRAVSESRGPDQYEVVFAVEDAQTARPAREQNAGDRDPGLDRLAGDIATMRKQIERMASTIGYAVSGQTRGTIAAPETAQAFAALVRTGVHPEIAHELALRAGSATLEQAVREALQTDPWSAGSPARRIAAFIGPPGGGKTTTLTKVAAAYGLARRVPTQVLTCDVRRIAAADQLRTLCSILGIGLEIVETPGKLENALMEHRNKGLILVDTPGCSAKDMPEFEDFAAFLAGRTDIEKHLILPASTKSEDLSRIADMFSSFAYTHLAFCRVDETSTFGCVLNETRRTGRPVSFLCGGPDVPEDLEEADPDRLTRLVLGLEVAALEISRAA
jgi:flagellar biosynthesis protein FlhF